MGTLVEATVPTDAVALEETFAAVPSVALEAVGVAMSDASQPMPILRATASNPREVDTALREDDTTASVQVLFRGDGRPLYRIRWAPAVRSRLRTLVDTDGALLDARAKHERWELRLLYPDHGAASRAHERCSERGMDLEVRQVTGETERLPRGEHALSSEQYEALVTAFRTEYYHVPREITQVELADRLGLSHQALSERLRRGHQGLISCSLGVDLDDGPSVDGAPGPRLETR